MNRDQRAESSQSEFTQLENHLSSLQSERCNAGATLFWVTNFSLIAVLVCMFWPCLSDSSIPSFRDTKTFYYPTWHWEDASNSLQEQSLEWNRFIGTGVSVIGEPTSQSGYPPTQLIKLCFPSRVATQIGVYLVFHLAMSGLLAGLSLRMLGLSWFAAAFGTVTMALSGPVFFQVYNLIYLVGATWTPLAITSLLWAVMQNPWLLKFRRRLVVLSISILAWTLLIFGGDVQSFANGWILLIVILPIFWIQRQCRFFEILTNCGYVVFMSIGLASAQILPTLDWVAHSSRPDNLSQIYEFSIAPWHLITYAWPSFFGSFTSGHDRWSAVFVDEPRMWIPSHYCGTLTLVLMLSLLIGLWMRKIRLTHSNVTAYRFGMLIFFIATLFSFGEFGIGWLFNWHGENTNLTHSNYPPEKSAFGGLYWLATKVVPNYSQFRYPAKWVVIATYGLVLIGGIGFEQICKPAGSSQNMRTWVGWCLCAMGVFSLAGCLVTLFWTGFLETAIRVENIPADFHVGRFDVNRAVTNIQLSLLLSGCSGLLFGLLLVFAKFRRLRSVLVMLLFVDLAIVNFYELSFTVKPKATLGVSSDDEVLDGRQMPFGRLNLLQPIRSMNAQFSIEPNAVKEYRYSNIGPDISFADLSWLDSQTAILDCEKAGDYVVPILLCNGWSIQKIDDADMIAEDQSNISLSIRDVVYSQLTVAEPCTVKFHYTTPGLALGRSVSLFTFVVLLATLFFSTVYNKPKCPERA